MKEKIPSVKGKHTRSRESTVMIMGQLGKVRSFKISGRLVFYSSLFFILYIALSIFLINDWFERRQTMMAQSNRMASLEGEIIKNRKNLDRYEKHIALLENFINYSEERKEEEESGKSEEIKGAGGKQSPEQRALEKDEKRGTTRVVEIREMSIQKRGSTITILFKLHNNQPDDDPASGYIHIVAMDNRTDPMKVWVYPKEELQNGLPINIQRGKPFLIKRFKPIKADVHLKQASEIPTAIKVLIYDRSGILLLEENFEVRNPF
ncbi:MAG: hypothetical protein ABIG67_03955 [Pseudomonadota bacterium]